MVDSNLECEICGAKEHPMDKVENSVFCGWCAARMRDFVRLSKLHEVVNIFWGSGKVDSESMRGVMRLIKARNIKSIIEYGSGLSTEILWLLADELYTFDEFKKHSDLCARLKTTKLVKYFSYDPKNKQLPDLNRKFDFAFVDGGQERSAEVRHAMKHADLIYLHDPNQGEQSFFPGNEFKQIAFKLYERIK